MRGICPSSLVLISTTEVRHGLWPEQTCLTTAPPGPAGDRGEEEPLQTLRPPVPQSPSASVEC